MKKARKADQLFVGTPASEVGPVESKLLSYKRVQGLVFGAFGEASEPLHRLIDLLADSRVYVAGLQRGKGGQLTSSLNFRSIPEFYISIPDFHKIINNGN